MSDEINNLEDDLLLEQLVLEIITIYKQIDRQRDEIGIITQWGIGPWLILKNLSEHEPQTVEEIAKLQHVSAGYCLQMLMQLENEDLIVKTSVDDVDKYALAHNGEIARKRLRHSWHAYLEEFENQFKDDELKSALSLLAKLRHMIEKKN